jgi:hypothetical protein
MKPRYFGYKFLKIFSIYDEKVSAFNLANGTLIFKVTCNNQYVSYVEQ